MQYIKFFYHTDHVSINYFLNKEEDNFTVKNNIKLLLKNHIVFLDEGGKILYLTSKGKQIIFDQKNYNAYVIQKWWRSIQRRKCFKLKEIRKEQSSLRNLLLTGNNENMCIFCIRKFPNMLIELSHVKPRCKCNYHEIKDIGNLQLVCRICHRLFDDGLICISSEGKKIKSNTLSNEDVIHYIENGLTTDVVLNDKQKIYYKYHNNTIFVN
jgi:predicted restriction endonuclease